MQSKQQLTSEIKNFQLKARTSVLSRKEKDDTDLLINQLTKFYGIHSIKPLFSKKMLRSWEQLFGNEFAAVFKYSFKPLPRIARINSLKTTITDFRKMVKKYSRQLKDIKGFRNTFEIKTESGEDFNIRKEYLNGLFYFQQLSSMLPVIALDPKPGDKILDIGAAPGSKTTQIGEIMKNKGQILANDIDKERLGVLKNTVKRMGTKIVKFHFGKGASRKQHPVLNRFEHRDYCTFPSQILQLRSL